MKCLHFFPITELNAFLPSLFVSKSTKVIRFMHSSASPIERIGARHDAKQGIFNKISDMRQCSMNKRRKVSSHEET